MTGGGLKERHSWLGHARHSNEQERDTYDPIFSCFVVKDYCCYFIQERRHGVWLACSTGALCYPVTVSFICTFTPRFFFSLADIIRTG